MQVFEFESTKDASLVILSTDDTALNDVNDDLIPSLLEEGTHILKRKGAKLIPTSKYNQVISCKK